MTTRAELHAWTAANLRARRAYYNARDDEEPEARAKAVRKAESQQRYRDRQKGKP